MANSCCASGLLPERLREASRGPQCYTRCHKIARSRTDLLWFSQTYQDRGRSIAEVNAAYIGGTAKGKRGRGAANKTPVVTLVSRDGEARSAVMQTVTADNNGGLLNAHMEQHAKLMTDSYRLYRKPA